MSNVPFTWYFIALAVVVDLVGLFYLWRRRNSPVGINHRPAAISSPRKRIPPAERRRRDRRGPDRAASA